MKTATSSSQSAESTAEKQLNGFIDKFDPMHRALIRDVRKPLRKRTK